MVCAFGQMVASVAVPNSKYSGLLILSCCIFVINYQP